MAGHARAPLAPLDRNTRPRAPLQPLQALKLKSIDINNANIENKNAANGKKERLVQPPVAQFQAFSVYEHTSEEKTNAARAPTRANNKQKENHVSPSILKLHSHRIPSVIPDDEENTTPCTSEKPETSSALKRYEEKKATAKTLREQFFHVAQYREEIYKYMREIETKYRARNDYMAKQADITHSMRAILVDWLVEVSEEYRLQTETLYLAVSYIDRFLSYMSVVRAKLQLVGTTAMFIASKYEEIYPPELREFVYITDETYTKQQVLRMEHLILKVLSFDLSTPTPLAFISLFCISNSLSQRTLFLAMYISELSLLEADPYLRYPASILGASSLAVARHALFCCHCSDHTCQTPTNSESSDIVPLIDCTQAAWPTALQRTSGYNLADLENCMRELARTHAGATSHPQQAIVEKYRSDKYEGVAHIKPKSMYHEAEPIVESKSC